LTDPERVGITLELQALGNQHTLALYTIWQPIKGYALSEEELSPLASYYLNLAQRSGKGATSPEELAKGTVKSPT
jgi:hypothetical protein